MTAELEQIKVADLIPYANNSRTHSDQQIKQVAASIKEFGFLNPVITDGENGIIAGHCRVMAAERLGLDEIPCLEASHLTEAQKKAYVIADNKLALNSGWDIEVLTTEIKALDELNFNLDVIGFDQEELKVFLEGVSFNPATEDDQGKLDELDPKYIDCPHCGKEFDMRGIA